MTGRSKQIGFSVPEILVVIAVIVGLACAGWFIYQRSQPTSNTTPTHTQATTTPESKTPSTGQGTQFDITELNVRLTIPDGLKDVTYVIDTTSVPGTSFAHLTTKNLQAIDGATSQCTASNAAIGAIWRVNSNPQTSDVQANASKSLGSDYVVYQRPQQGCSANVTAGELQNSQAKLLEVALSSAANIK